MYSPDVISFAREKGYFDGVNKDFSFAKAYAPLDFGARRYCEARVWSYFNMFTARGNEFLPYILGDTDTPMPLFVKSDRKNLRTGRKECHARPLRRYSSRHQQRFRRRPVSYPVPPFPAFFQGG